MARLLFPGRHHLLTNFQLDYLTRVASGDPTTLLDVDGRPLGPDFRLDAIVWAVTSANHANTRRNPLPAHRREVAIEEFAEQLDVPSFVYLIDDVGASPRFAQYVIRKIDVDSQGRFRLTPADTVVACSTLEVIPHYEQLGFRVLPIELADRAAQTFVSDTPWHLLTRLVRLGLEGKDWRTDGDYLMKASRASRRLYAKYGYGDLIVDLHRSPILTDDGGLTATRDYNAYVRAFDEGAARKCELVRDHVLPGRIVDIGCCTGALIRELTRDARFRESDFFGVEVARQLYVECLHRKEQGDFANDHVFFYQKDFAAGPVFAEGSVNTFLTFSMTHEIESYAGRDALLRFMRLLHAQLAWQGRWLNVDVVGPEGKERTVHAWFDDSDGRSDGWDREFDPSDRDGLKDFLSGLSTFARFLRFARDFRRDEGNRLNFSIESLDGRRYVVLTLKNACEFLSKKDYLQNWQSEMHETFCHWDFDEWKQAAEAAGFRVLPQSHVFTNPWIVANRYEGRAALYERKHDRLDPLPWPVTNMVLVVEKAETTGSTLHPSA